jgi:hypothetical protein
LICFDVADAIVVFFRKRLEFLDALEDDSWRGANVGVFDLLDPFVMPAELLAMERTGHGSDNDCGQKGAGNTQQEVEVNTGAPTDLERDEKAHVASQGISG